MKSKTIFSDSSIGIDCLDFCSLSFLSLALLDEREGEILFFSSQNYLLVKSELNHLKINSDIYKDYQERVAFIFLKQAFTQLENTFFQEFEMRISQFQGQLIYFDRIDYFLDFCDYKKFEKTLQHFKNLVEKYDKKIIYIYNSKSDKHPYLHQAMHKNSTIFDFNNQKNKEQNMPLLDHIEKEILQETSGRKKIIHSSDTKIQVMLMSDNDEQKKLHYYIFSSSSDVDYYTIDILPDDEMNILAEMDIIIFNKDDENLKRRILAKIAQESLNTKFFEITKQDYLRQKDLLNANLEGVDRLFKRDYLMEDFVMSIEMYLKNSFYSKRLLTLDDSNNIMIKNREDFEEKIAFLLDKKIFFSRFTYHYDADTDIENYNVQKIVREYDNIFINKRKKEIHFLILNTVPNFGKELIEKRIQNFSITLDFISAKSAFDLIFE